MLEIDPGDGQHLARLIDAERALHPRRQDFEHAPGSSADVEQIARVRRGDEVDKRRLDFALVDIERADSVPLRCVLAKIGGGKIGTLLLDCAQALQIESDGRIIFIAGPDQLTRQRPRRTGLAQAIEDPAAFAEAIEQPGLAQQLEMTRHARLALPEDLGQFADGQFPAGAQHGEPQPGRLGHRAQRCQQMFHCQQDIQISLYTQWIFGGASIAPLSLAKVSRNYPARRSNPSPMRGPIDECFAAAPGVLGLGCRPGFAHRWMRRALEATPQAAPPGAEDFNDPLEDPNRAIFKFNQSVDHAVLVPVAKAYRTALPDPVRNSVRDFLYNLRAPLIFANDALQGDFGWAKDTFARFVINTTIGMGGLVDVAGRWGIPYHEQDFGVTLGVWGIAEGPYLVVPVLGPSDPRDLGGQVAEGFADPWNIVASNHHMIWIAFVRGAVSGIDQRSRYIETLADIERTSLDYYATIRSLYRQRRAALVHHKHEQLPPKSVIHPQRRSGAGDRSGEPGCRADRSLRNSRRQRGIPVILRRSLIHTAFAVILGVAGLAAAGFPAPAAAAADPAAVINDLGNQALEVLGKDVTSSQRDARFRELFHHDFDLPTIARFVLGRYWRLATPSQQQEFIRLFAEYTALAYSNRLAEYSGETLKVTGSRAEPDGSIVTSEIVRTGGAPPAKVDWRMARTDDGYKITDVIIEGISMAVTQRSEFASVIRRHGGQLEGLLTVLRAKTASAGAPR